MARKTAQEKRDEAMAARSDEIEQVNQAAVTRPDQVASAHGVGAQAKRSGGTVIVGCKLGIAYLDLQLTALKEVYENTQTGPRKIMEARRYGPVVRIRGTAYPRGTPPSGFPEKPIIVNGAALTEGVDEDFWNEWAEVNKLNPLVTNGMVFAHKDLASVKDHARDLKDVHSGLEPINPAGDPRAPKSTRADITNVETEESRTATMVRLNTGG